MNFNQGSGQGQGAPAQQQYGARQAQKMSMLPPQFQNLTPQQLQELKNKPQFQNMLRQYFQRQQKQQQQMQQQQMQQQQMMRQGKPAQGQQMPQGVGQSVGQNLGDVLGQGVGMGQSTPGMGQATQGMPASGMGQMAPGMMPNMASQNLMGQNMSSRGAMAPGMSPPQGMSAQQQQMYNRNVQAAYLQQQQQKMQRQQGMGQMGQMGSVGGAVPPNAAVRGGMPKYPGAQMPVQRQVPPQGIPTGNVALSMSPQAAAAAAVAAAKYGAEAGAVSGIVNNIVPPAALVGPTGLPGGLSNTISSNMPLDASASAAALLNGAADAPVAAKEQITIPPNFAPDSLRKLNLKPLKSHTEWSDKLKAEGKEVPLELKIYEGVIKKDEDYLRKAYSQNKRSKQLLERMARDIKTYAGIKQLRMNSINASAKNQYNNSIWGEGYQGYGNGISNTATQVVFAHQNKSFARMPNVPYTDAQINETVLQNINSGKAKDLVPIRLTFDKERDAFKLRDTFLWDLNDATFPLESFVKSLIDDYKFISDHHFHAVIASITEQIKDYRKLPEKTMGEIRVPIKIDFIINNTQFTDQFEWDILNIGESDPEDFATILCDEMSLPGEFATAIAFSIREQAQLYHKALFLVGYSFDGSLIREDEIRSHLLPALRILSSDGAAGQIEDFVSTLRNPSAVADFSPSLNTLTQLEIEKIDKEMERDSRRRRRHLNNENSFSYNENGPNLFGNPGRGTASRRSALHAGRGVKMTLPDLSEIPKTFRTPVPSSILPGGIDLGVPDVYGYNELIINRTQIKNTDYKPPAPPGMVTFFRDTAGSFYVKIRLRRNNQG